MLLIGSNFSENMKMIEINSWKYFNIRISISNLSKILSINKFVIFELNYWVLHSYFIPTWTNIGEFMCIFESQCFTIVIPWSDEDQFWHIFKYYTICFLNIMEYHLWSLEFIFTILLHCKLTHNWKEYYTQSKDYH